MNDETPRTVGYTRRWGDADKRARAAQKLWTDRGIAQRAAERGAMVRREREA
jgi:hypothetical protein